MRLCFACPEPYGECAEHGCRFRRSLALLTEPEPTDTAEEDVALLAFGYDLDIPDEPDDIDPDKEI